MVFELRRMENEGGGFLIPIGFDIESRRGVDEASS
jgi:hypothetical protein